MTWYQTVGIWYGSRGDRKPRFAARSFILFIAFLALAGCAKTDSENVKSKGISAGISVVADGRGDTDVWTTLEVGNGLFATQLTLSSSDHLLAYANGITKVMKYDGFPLLVAYQATFPFDDEDTEFRVEFNREQDVSAPNSTVTLPAPFSITSAKGVTYAKDAIVSVNWEPAYTPDRMLVDYNVNCTGSDGGKHPASYTVGADDNGQRDISVAEILANASPGFSDSSKGCSMEITVMRQRTGTIDPHYGEGGQISAEQRRSINAGIAP